MLLTIKIAALLSGVDPSLLASICWIESRHKEEAINKDDGGSPSYGLCQVKLSTANWIAGRNGHNTLTVKQLMEPLNNAYFAGLYLRYQTNRYETTRCAVSAYNAGRCILSNKAYVDKVLKIRHNFYK